MKKYTQLAHGASLLYVLSLATSVSAATPAATPAPTLAGGLGPFLLQFVALIDLVLVPLLFAVAFIVFIFGIYRFFIQGGANEEKRETGKQLMVWGFIGFFIMFTVWGIVNLLKNSSGLGDQTRPDLPTFSAPTGATSGSPTATGLPKSP